MPNGTHSRQWIKPTHEISNSLSVFQTLPGVAASRQSAAFFARKQEVGGALPRRRYGVLKKAPLNDLKSNCHFHDLQDKQVGLGSLC